MSGQGIFRPDSAYNRFMTKVFDLFILNVLWAICCLPIITIGASTTAMYSVTLKMVHDQEGGIVKSFFKAFRENLRQSIPVTLCLLVFAGVLTADFYILSHSQDNSAAMIYGVCVTMLILGGAIFGYVFPLLAFFENTIRNTFNNSARIAVCHLPQTAMMLGINFLPLICFITAPETFFSIYWVWIFGGTGAAAYANSIILRRIFDRLTSRDQEEEQNEEI